MTVMDKLQCPKFSGRPEDWDSWKFSIKAYLGMLGLLKYIIPGRSDGVSTETATTEKERLFHIRRLLIGAEP